MVPFRLKCLFLSIRSASLIGFFIFFIQISTFFNCVPINRSQFPYSTAIHQLRKPINGQSSADHSDQNNAIHPPHCSKAIVTVAQSSKLTKRATSSHPNSSTNRAFHGTQLSLNIGVGQSVCFKMQDAEVEDSNENNQSDQRSGSAEEVITETTSNFTFIVALAGRSNHDHRKRIEKGRNNEEEEVESGNVLHSITVLDLEQYHAITERYRFAIPELETRCICECESGSANCAADRYKYGRCDNEFGDQSSSSSEESAENPGPRLNWAKDQFGVKPHRNSVLQQWHQPTVCHRTFFANQPSGQHCSASKRDQQSSSARLCCQLRFRAFRNRQFIALRLESAVSSALLQYSQWIWRETEEAEEEELFGTPENRTNTEQMPKVKKRPHWVELDRRRVRVQMDGTTHNTMLNELLGLKLSVMGLSGAKSAGAQLEPGVYFVERHSADGSLGEIIGQMPVNRITEHDFHKLGWFRLDERGRPFVQSGEMFLDKIHHAKVNDCAAQRYRSVLDASYYVNADNNDTSQFRLADPLSAVHKWVKSARVLDVHQRIALVRASEGLSLEVTLTTKARPDGQGQSRQNLLAFVHNSSRLGDFTAVLVIDQFSNSLLNLTLFNASGVLNGFVRRLADPEGSEIDGFSINMPSEGNGIDSVILSIKPYPMGTIHVVCLRPDDAELSQELCRPVQTIYHELEVNTVKNEWNEAIGDCPKCNQISAEGFAKYLNPANWVKGISSVSDALMLASDIFGYFIVLMVVYFVIVKIAIPLIGCCCVTPSCCSPKSGKK